MLSRLLKNHYAVAVAVACIAYAVYFSWFTILRYQTLNSAHADLGIMHQAAYNTYRAIQTGDYGRFLELTNPHPPGSTNQITRTAIHVDLLLAVTALFYFLYAGPETLLVLQSIALALGAWLVFKIAEKVLEPSNRQKMLAALLAFGYLLYPPLHQVNSFDFHAVAFAIPLLLLLFYGLLEKRYGVTLIALGLAVLAKEQVSLTTGAIGIYFCIKALYEKKRAELWLPATVVLISTLWFFAAFYMIMPAARDTAHYALSRYQTFGTSPVGIMTGVLFHPGAVYHQLMQVNAGGYIVKLLTPILFLPILAPAIAWLLIPELAFILLSNEPLMHSFAYHYAAVLIPLIFIAAIYGLKKVQHHLSSLAVFVLLLLIAASMYWYSPLPGLRSWNPYKFQQYADQREVIRKVSRQLADENLKISATTSLSPWLTSRRYFFLFTDSYPATDYIVLNKREVDAKSTYTMVYERLKKDDNFIQEYDRQGIQVYRRK